ncbi:MAG: tRNA glutamyl-Q(34) synthetase GluQRS [Deltaproteobacteria bacterium]|nr:tRNA glutamyl-Q(34) synthetase GluQRS [Deltaproteobacteria bacterium]
MSAHRGRFAPSPTGDLHLGCAATAVVTWLVARAAGGTLALRIEDIDGPRVVAGMAERQLDDLRWLGLDWDEGPDRGGEFGPYVQSQRFALYEAALASLAQRDVVYWCDCSRAEIARVASAPHAGEEGPPYPGLCRSFGLEKRSWKRPPALRLRVPPGEITIEDRFQGKLVQDVAHAVGDFVLKRGDGVYAYQLAVVVDDLAMGITEVVRGADLLSSAPRQAVLAELLGFAVPRFAHAPLVLSPDGSRLAKRARGITLRDHREAGRAPEEIVALLARTLGLLDPGELTERLSPRELRSLVRLDRLAGRREVRLEPGIVEPDAPSPLGGNARRR